MGCIKQGTFSSTRGASSRTLFFKKRTLTIFLPSKRKMHQGPNFVYVSCQTQTPQVSERSLSFFLLGKWQRGETEKKKCFRGCMDDHKDTCFRAKSQFCIAASAHDLLCRKLNSVDYRIIWNISKPILDCRFHREKGGMPFLPSVSHMYDNQPTVCCNYR